MMNNNFSRRTVLKSFVALAGTGAMAGCSKDDGSIEYINSAVAERFSDEPLQYTAHYGNASHNCGGGCAIQMHVKDGKVKRIVTDEYRQSDKLDFTKGDDPQRRACVRCRSKATWFYRQDRLLYPLKQTGERGDPAGFKRITWKQAFEEIGTKIKTIVDMYGTESVFPHYSSGDGSSQHGAGLPIALGHAIGLGSGKGYNAYRFDYSFVNYMHAWNIFCNPPNGATSIWNFGNSRQDFINAEFFLLWGHNTCENIWGTNSMYYLRRAKDIKNMPIWSVDQRYNRTANILADEVITPVATTDSALLLAMMYVMIDENLIDPLSINKYIYGFFDGASHKVASYYPDRNDSTGNTKGYSLPAGGSLSAYIMGSDNRLVTAGINRGISIYPNEIGYDVNRGDAVDSPDPLVDKMTPIYGQIPKTPEWAEKITGVKAAKIRELARLVVEKKTTMLVGASLQRNSEGEQVCWLLMTMMAVSGNFGQAGASMGFSTDRSHKLYAVLPDMMYGPTGAGLMTDPAYFPTSFKARYDESKLSHPDCIQDIQKHTLPMAAWLDIVDHSNVTNNELTNDPEKPKYHCTGSKWNDMQVKNGSPIKFIYNHASNMITNQGGDYHECVRIMKDRTKAELVVTQDPFMTPSAIYSDYVLPAALPFERTHTKSNWIGGGESLTYTAQALKRPGEVISDYEMACGILKHYNDGGAAFKLFTDGDNAADYNYTDILPQKIEKTISNYVANGVMPKDVADKLHNERAISMSPYLDEGGEGAIVIAYKQFLADPTDVSHSGRPNTATGRLEVFSPTIIEDYEAKGHNSVDTSGTLENGGTIATLFTGDINSRRFVYPIPMYIPCIEGSHYCDEYRANYHGATAVQEYQQGMTFNADLLTSNGYKDDGATRHPDLLHPNKDEYTFRLVNWHLMYRSHSTLNTNAYTNEFYKKDRDGNPAFATETKPALQVYEDNVYETAWINKSLAESMKFSQGDLAIVSSQQGKIVVSLELSESIQPFAIMMGEGAWTYMKNGVDVGGNPNTLISQRISRINKGNCLSNDTRVKIEHYSGAEY